MDTAASFLPFGPGPPREGRIPYVRKRLPKFPLVRGSHECAAVALLSLIMLLQRRYLLLLERAGGRARVRRVGPLIRRAALSGEH